MVVQPWGRVLVPTQEICITICLSSSAELGSPPQWRMVTSGWAQDSWSTALLPHHWSIRTKSYNPNVALFLGPSDDHRFRLPVWSCLFCLWQGSAVLSWIAVLKRLNAGFRHRIPLLRSGRERFLLCYAGLGEGNVNPLQYSCLENLMDWGSW